MQRCILTMLLVALSGGIALPADPPQRLILLPIQDRVGDPALIEAVEAVVREQLAGRYLLTHPTLVRDGLRAGRIRDAGATTPARLAGLAADLEADRFLSITVHRAVAGPVPDIILSGNSFKARSNLLEWAGFRSASGLDGRKMLGRGVIQDLDILTRKTARTLIDDFLLPAANRTGRVGAPIVVDGEFRRGMINPTTMSPLAVLPFDAVVPRQPQIVAEIATAAMLAVLHRHGVPLTHPGAADDILRGRFRLRYGGLDDLTRAALFIGPGATRFITGTVEVFEMKGGIEPVPWIALGVRVVEVESGQIFWIGGVERTGQEEENVFGADRVHSPGALLDGMLDAIGATLLRKVEVERDGSK